MNPQSALAQLRAGKPADDESLLDLGLLDLMEAKQAFEPRDKKQRSSDGLGPAQFVAEFSRLCGEDKATQLSYLFMKIDCNSDGQVTWDEFLSYVMLQDTTKSQPLQEELSQSKFAPQDTFELALGQLHRDTISHVLFLPKTQSYVTASPDSTLRVWHGTTLRPLGTLSISERTGTAVNAIAALPDALGKLAVACNDRVVSFYELHDQVGHCSRWTVLTACYSLLTTCLLLPLPLTLALSFSLAQTPTPTFNPNSQP